MKLEEIFEEHEHSSTTFASLVTTHCGYEVSHEEIWRIADAAVNREAADRGIWEAKHFHAIWLDETWWQDERHE